MKPLQAQINEHREIWQELWWNMADGEVTAYRELKRMDVFEFYAFFDRWRDRMQKESELMKKQRQQQQQHKRK